MCSFIVQTYIKFIALIKKTKTKTKLKDEVDKRKLKTESTNVLITYLSHNSNKRIHKRVIDQIRVGFCSIKS